MKYEDILKNDWHLKRCGRGMVLKALQNACRKRRGTVVDSNRKMQPEASVEAPGTCQLHGERCSPCMV